MTEVKDRAFALLAPHDHRLTEQQWAGSFELSRGHSPAVAGRDQRAATVRTLANATRRELSLVRLFTEADTNAGIRGTRWAGYQAVTEYLDHYAPVDGKRNTADVRVERVVSGQVSELKSHAFALLAPTAS